jgi:hypothetical protein
MLLHGSRCGAHPLCCNPRNHCYYMARPTTRSKALQYLMREGDLGWLSPLLWAEPSSSSRRSYFQSDSVAVGVEGRGPIRPLMHNALCPYTRQLLQFLHVHFLERAFRSSKSMRRSNSKSRSCIEVRRLDGSRGLQGRRDPAAYSSDSKLLEAPL